MKHASKQVSHTFTLCSLLHAKRDMEFKDWSLITGRGATKREGGGGYVKFYPYEKKITDRLNDRSLMKGPLTTKQETDFHDFHKIRFLPDPKRTCALFSIFSGIYDRFLGFRCVLHRFTIDCM